MTRLIILHTNDIHGRAPQLLRIAAMVKTIKQDVNENGSYCLYLDAGDAEDTRLLESCLTRGTAMDALLRAACCDHVALGNAIPIRYGQQEIPELAGTLGKPLLCANLLEEDGSSLPGLEPYRLQELGNLTLGIIGLTAPLEFYAPFFRLDARNPLEVLPGWVEEVRARGAKTVIVLSHIGSEVDLQIAEKVSGVDLIIGGHDHKVIHPPVRQGSALVAQAGAFGRYLGRLDLEIDDASGKIIKFDSSLLEVTDDLPEDSEAVEAFRVQQRRAQELMSIPVGELTGPLDLSFTSECSAANLLADALLDRVEGAEIGLAVAGHWSTGLDAGMVTKGSLIAALRSTGNPARVRMTGAQIEAYLCKALNPQMAGRLIHPLRGNPVGLAHVAGLTVAGGSLESGKLTLLVGGKPLDLEREYIVATSDLEISDVLEYQVIPYSETQFEMPTILAEVLEDYIRRLQPLTPPATGRISPQLLI